MKEMISIELILQNSTSASINKEP